MSDKRYEANIIRATAVEPANNLQTTSAPGVWSIDEVVELQKKDKWPTVGNVPTDVADVFSIYLYEGTGSAQTITNGVDLSGEGGLVWIKNRENQFQDHSLFDTTRSPSYVLYSNTTSASSLSASRFSSFNTNGFTVGTDTSTNESGKDIVSWTFRKAPKFFDVQTWTGNGSNRTIAHNLGCEVGMMLVKLTSGADGWAVYHRGVDSSTPEDYRLRLDGTNARIDNTDGSRWNRTAPTSSVFSLGTDGSVNANGSTYVAYLFAHNNDDGGFGEPGDQDIIKCGSYTGNSNSTGPIIDLGFEPQWIVVKRASNTGGWFVIDTMRGLAQSGTNDPFLRFDSNQQEYENPYLKPLATGFQPKTTSSAINYSGDTYVYMAIRRGGMQTPTAASDVFQATASLTGDRQNGDTITTTLDHADWHFARRTGTSYSGYNQTRINGWKYLVTDATDVEASATLKQGDNNNKLEYTGSWHSADNDVIDYFWKRARGFFDVVVYEGPSSTGNISHNLGVVPEMIWVKNTAATENWAVYHKDLGNTYYLHLNTDAASSNTDGGNFWNSTTPTASVFSVGTSTLTSHYTRKHVAYLFASVSDVSKVGSYTGNSSSSQNIDCGFTTAGVEFLLIKSTSSGDWYVWDRLRGITSGNDPYIRFNNTAAETTNTDHIDTFSTGFTVNSDFNTENEVYIFYAIATG